MQNPALRVEPAEIVFPPTYISTSTKTVCEVWNKSNNIINYEIRKYSNTEDEISAMTQCDIDDPESRQKYLNSLFFESPDFSIEPQQGEIWPGRKQNLIVIFHPKSYGHKTINSFITDAKTNERRVLPLSGQCLPPSAKFSVSLLNIGHVTLDSINEYQLMLKNTGEAEVNFSLIKNETNPTILFEPEIGTIHVGGFMPISIKVIANKVGQFTFDFKYMIEGANEADYPIVNVYGRVLGPTFKVSTKSIDFGVVSCGFLYTNTFNIQNTSDIPLEFSSKIVSDDGFNAREFSISPGSGTISPHSSIPVSIEFIPSQLKRYSVQVVFDGTNGADSLFAIPVTGVSKSPSITVDTTEINAGMIYVNYPYKFSINLICNNKMPGKFDILQPNDDEFGYTIELPRETGIVPENSSTEVPFIITAQQLGPMSTTRLIRIYGSDDPPIVINLNFTSIGPTIELSSEQVRFGKISVLDIHKQVLTIRNASLIPCEYSTSIEKYSDVFKIENGEGIIEPNEAANVTVLAQLDDNSSFSTNLILSHSYSLPQKIPILAQGLGHCFKSSIDMENIEISSAFAGQNVEQKFTLTNNGRVANEIRWNIGKIVTEGNGELVASITPQTRVIDAHSEAEFSINLGCQVPCSFTFTANCSAQTSRSREDLFNPIIKCTFMKVLIDIKEKKMDFQYYHDADLEEKYSAGKSLISPSQNLLGIVERENEITNTSQLPLVVLLSCTFPFSLSDKRIELQPGDKYQFKVFLDTSFKKDFSTEIVDRRLFINFEGNNQKYTVFLHGVLNFPNIKLSNSLIDYGSVLISSENTKDLVLENIGCVPAKYEWRMFSGEKEYEKNSFDAFPLRGTIPPGQSEEVHFTFYGLTNENGKGTKFSAQAVCHVAGGPEYPVQLKGRTASIEYNVSPTSIDLGVIKYTDFTETQVVITNNGEANVKYKVIIPQKKEFEEVTVEPMSGVLKQNENHVLKICVWPGSPRVFKDKITITTGFFDDIIIDIFADSRYNRLLFTQDGVKENGDEQSERDFCIKQSLSLLQKPGHKQHIYYINRSKAKINTLLPIESEPLSSFVVDFGDFIMGNVIKKEFVITNDCPFPANFDINSKVLNETGFSISQNSCAGLPPGATNSIFVVFDPSKRTLLDIGEVSYSLNIMVTDEIYYKMTIKAVLKAPFLHLSTKKIEFPQTIVGQMMEISFQVQNLNDVPCTFEIQEGNSTCTASAIKCKKMFKVTPSNGTIEPQSFKNISIMFSPKGGKEYKMMFPFVTKYNQDVQMITVLGTGNVLKLSMFPPEANFEHILPFSEIASLQVLLTNPSKHQIEVFSRQFDLNLVTDRVARLISGTPLTKNRASATSIMNDANDLVSYSEARTKICFIVYGPPKSGCTEVSNKLAEAYGKIPVVKLEDIWKDLTFESSFDELRDAFAEATKEMDSFILDDIDYFNDAAEIHNFIAFASKQKGAHEEIMNNIFTEARRQSPLHIETEVASILAALKGWHVFLIGLIANEEELIARNERLIQEEQEIKPKKEQQRLEEIIRMTDEEYAALTEEEQDEVDTARKNYRDSIINANGTTGKEIGKPMNKVKKPQKKTKSNLPDDPFKLKVLKFFYTFGIIASEVMNSKENITCDISCFNDQQNINYQKNVILADAKETVDKSLSEILSCIPSLDVIKGHAFTNCIPPPRLTIPNLDAVPISDEPPEMFYIETNATEDAEFSNCTERWTINSGESVPIIVKFKGQKIGTYQDKLTFSISGCKTEIFTLPLKATISYPEIKRDIPSLLGDTVQNANSKTQLVYVNSMKSFFFGYQVIAKEKTIKAASKLTKDITLFNTSVFPVVINAMLTEPQQKGIWSIDQTSLTIQPDEEAKITVAFQPLVAGKQSNTVAIYIKDNPEPLFIPFSSVVCIPTLKFSTDVIDFEKIITNQVSTHIFEIENTDMIPAYWRVKGGNTLGQAFDISPLEGTINPKGTQQVVLTFSSKKQIVFKKPIQIEVMDKTKLRTFDTYPINIIAEAFDVNFDIEFENGANCLDFGVMRAGTQKTQKLVMKTRGKYPIMFQFKFKSKSVSQLFNIFPLNGGVQPNDKGTVVTFTYCSDQHTKYVNAKGLVVAISDSLTGSEIATVPVPFNAQTVFSQFVLEPENVLDFGLIPAGEQTTKEITIRNIGVFDFPFVVLPQAREENDAHNISRKSIKQPKGAPSSKRPAVAKSPISISINSAVIAPQSLSIKPGESSTIKATVTPQNGQKINIPFLIKVGNCDPVIADGIVYTLEGSPIVPSIVTDDYETIFKNVNICSRSELILGDINSYIHDQKILHFAPIPLTTTTSVIINAINKQPVEAEVTISVKSGKKEGTIWSVNPPKFTIPPNSSFPFEVSFVPSDCGNFKATLMATVKNSPSVFQCQMEATSSIPTVAVETRSEKTRSKSTDQSFSRLLVSFKKEKTVIITNTSSLPATVMLQATPNPDFILPSLDSSQGKTIEPMENIIIPVIFAPQKAKKSSFSLSITIAENVKYSKVLEFSGEGFCEPVYFEGNSTGDCDLMFKDTIVGTPVKLDFKLHNVSTDCYRFQFAQNQFFTFMPRIGHIHPESTKTITCTFIADRPNHFVGTKAICSRTKIEIDPKAPDWDETHGSYNYVKKSQLNPQIPQMPSGRELSKRARKFSSKNLTLEADEIVKVYQIDPEPPYTASKDKPKEMTLQINAAADVIQYQLSDNEFEFPPTMMYEKKYHCFSITNTSSISFDFDWSIGGFTSLNPTYSLKYVCPFTVQPQSGTIMPGEEFQFKATFAPLSDDEFSAKAVCKIPGLFDIPVISLRAISQRPIIHINMELSDYLTSKRRTSEFTEEVPINTRVIELISKEKGAAIKKMIEMINTTDTPYEIQWTCKFDHSNGSIKCMTPSAFISSGKRFFSTFIFTPKEIKTVEALWSFTIPNHSITADILIVGRVTNRNTN